MPRDNAKLRKLYQSESIGNLTHEILGVFSGADGIQMHLIPEIFRGIEWQTVCGIVNEGDMICLQYAVDDCGAPDAFVDKSEAKRS